MNGLTRGLFFLAVGSLLVGSIRASDDTDDSVGCHTLSRNNFTCGHCIRLNPKCSWCSQKSFADDQFSRCDTYSRLVEHFCEKDFIEAPLSSKPLLIKNEPLSGTVLSDVQDRSEKVQMQPQIVRLQLRPHDKVNFTLKHKQAVGYPVDLYYLMDMTHTMADDKKMLVTLGRELVDHMRNVTGNFRLGFGSFVDKEVQPFIETNSKLSKQFCTFCIRPYDFWNHLSLSYESEEFVNQVRDAQVSFSLDGPEGGLDAIIQATICKVRKLSFEALKGWKDFHGVNINFQKQIGWRDGARKIILYASNSLFHIAGDGRIAGIVEPNDGQCHLGADGRTDVAGKFDYPSISRLRHTLLDNKMNILFAVTEDRAGLYDKLVNELSVIGITTSVSELAEDSSNVVEVVKREYEKIAKIVSITDNSSRTADVRINYYATCMDGKEVVGSTCRDVAVGEEVQFRVEVEFIGESAKPITISINPVGLDDTTYVHIHPVVDCGCEDLKSPTFLPNAAECRSRGNLTCGVCLCQYPYKGSKCDCEKPGYSNEELDAQCRKGSDLRTPLCEGRGHCECGQCKCKQRANANEVVNGQYCECDNFNCPRTDRKICYGHGRCVCQACKCDSGWSGISCDCPTGQASCMADNGLVCSGRGHCDCGVCTCGRSPDGFRYSGPTCELCPTCPDKCEQFRGCVMCRQFKTGPFNDTVCQTCINPENYKVVKELEDILTPSVTKCQFDDPKDDCRFYFAYFYDHNTREMQLWAKEKKRCPKPVILAIVLGVIGGIVGLGVLLLVIWKILMTLYDRREYKMFLKESESARFNENENPLFKPAITTFENPFQQARNRRN